MPTTRGYIRFEKKEYDQAIDDLTESIILDPENADTHSRYWLRGKSRKAKHAYDAAIGDFSEAIKLKPTDAWFYVERGNVWVEKNSLKQSRICPRR